MRWTTEIDSDSFGLFGLRLGLDCIQTFGAAKKNISSAVDRSRCQQDCVARGSSKGVWLEGKPSQTMRHDVAGTIGVPEGRRLRGRLPCPSFSNLGKGRGVNDSRGLLTLKGMEYIARTRPKMIVLEQVAAILQKKHEKVWNYVLKILKYLEYKYVYRVLNTKAFAVPQSRPRVYLLAVASEICQGALALPDERTQPVDLHHFLQKEVKGTEVLALPKYERLLGAQMWRKGYVLDVGSSEKFQSAVHNATPCLTRTRLSQRGYYIPKLQRRLLPEEAAALQGIPSQVFASMVAAATDFNIPSNAVAGSLGHGMSINVLTSVLMKGLHHSGLARYESRHEHWRLVENSEAAGLSDKLFQSSVLKLATATHATRNR